MANRTIQSVSDDEKIDLQVDLQTKQNELLGMLAEYEENPLSYHVEVGANTESFDNKLQRVESTELSDKTVGFVGDTNDYDLKST